MFATRHGNEIHISSNIITSLTGVTSGYLVEMHDPVIRCKLRIDAATLDDAHRAVLQFCHHSTHMLTTTGATIQRIRD